MYEILQKLKKIVISEYFARNDTFLWHVLQTIHFVHVLTMMDGEIFRSSGLRGRVGLAPIRASHRLLSKANVDDLYVR